MSNFEYSQERLKEMLNEYIKSCRKPNILICGQSGAGKSSIVNYIFKKEVAKTSDFEPCTHDIHLYKSSCINIYDSEGYELGKENRYKQLLFSDFLEKDEYKEIKGETCVHFVWYVVNGSGKRFTEYDQSLVTQIEALGYKVAIIISQIDQLNEDQLKGMVYSIRNSMGVCPLFRTSTSQDAIDARNENGEKYTDWEELVQWSYEQMPQMCKDRFASSLKKGLRQKEDVANNRIAIASAAAAAIGATPIPFSDAALLIPTQSVMVVSILNVYGIEFPVTSTALGSMLGELGLQNLGKSLATNLIKLIPGAGAIVGGVINASVASMFTFAIGKAVSAIAYKTCNDSIDGNTPILNLDDLFNEEFMDLFRKFYKKEK